jgi:hypothetical protein
MTTWIRRQSPGTARAGETRPARRLVRGRSVLPLATTLAFAACALIVPGIAHAGVVTPKLCPGALTLSGGPAPTEQIGVDDDLELRLNGNAFFVDNDGFAQDLAPIGFRAEFGDQLRVIATNGPFGGHEGIDPLYLTCDANDSQQVLDDTGFDAADGPAFEVFYDETFTIELGPPQTTITKHPKKKTKKREATFKFVADPADGATFECKADGKPFKPCDSTYKKKVGPGKHTFKVRATVDGVREPTPAKFKWKVLRD